MDRLAGARRDHPEWRVWLDLFAAAVEEHATGRWDSCLPPDRRHHRPGGGAPWLHDIELVVEGHRARRWVARVLETACRRKCTPDGSTSTALLEAAIAQDEPRLDLLSGAFGVEAGVLRVAAQFAALPLLQACRRAAEEDARAGWTMGYCPICAAWPSLAEFRGLERKRWLRCGRCGSGWEIGWLRCAFCGEADHQRLGYLTAEEREGGWKVEVCESCNGCLKAVAVVQATSPADVLLEDLGSVHLDLAAIERGYRRPDRAAFGLHLGVRAAARGFFATRARAGERGQ
jgi:FdhE protein